MLYDVWFHYHPLILKREIFIGLCVTHMGRSHTHVSIDVAVFRVCSIYTANGIYTTKQEAECMFCYRSRTLPFNDELTEQCHEFRFE